MHAKAASNRNRQTDDARARLMQAGLRLFAQLGFRQTSTRELAEAAQVNVAAISYYFGDKAGLYRAVFFEPFGSVERDLARFSSPTLPLAEALHGYFAAFLEPLRQGDDARQCIKLHFREMLEPTGLWEEQLSHDIEPLHHALLALLCRHLGLDQADDHLERLAVCLSGLGVHLHVGRDCTDRVAPRLNQDAAAIERWSDSLVLFGLAMVQAEAARRQLMSHEAP